VIKDVIKINEGSVLQDFPDGLFPAGGKSEIEGIFPPPYFEWFQFNKVGLHTFFFWFLFLIPSHQNKMLIFKKYLIYFCYFLFILKEFTEYTNLEECISHLCEYITSKGPFDGLLGFSQVELVY